MNVELHVVMCVAVDPARDLATLDEELYLSYRSGSGDDADPPPSYGFPSSYTL
jgi:hypothetical protein